MPRYINADALYALVDKAQDFAIQRLLSEPKNLPNGSLNPEYIQDLVRVTERTKIKDEISNAPTADVVERKKGKWIKHTDRSCWYCSCCNTDDYYAYLRDCDTGEYELQDHYCPNCGAEMEGSE